MKFVVLISSLLLLFGCNKSQPCIPKDMGGVHKIVRKEVIDFFPYKAGQIITFKRFSDTTFLGDVMYKCDSVEIFTQYGRRYSNPDLCSPIDTTDRLWLRMFNQTEKNNDCLIEVISNYAPNYYDGDQDFSELRIKFEKNDFGFWNFGQGVRALDKSYERDSIVIGGKNYGRGFCIDSGSGIKLYFNSTYGIILFANESTKERLVYFQ